MCLTVKVICDHKSGKSKGYGFVHFTTEIAASNALKEMNAKVCFFAVLHSSVCELAPFFQLKFSLLMLLFQILDGRNIRVQCVHKR